MKKEVEKYKKEFPYSKETLDIESKYNEVLTFYINTTLEVIVNIDCVGIEFLYVLSFAIFFIKCSTK